MENAILVVTFHVQKHVLMIAQGHVRGVHRVLEGVLDAEQDVQMSV